MKTLVIVVFMVFLIVLVAVQNMAVRREVVVVPGGSLGPPAPRGVGGFRRRRWRQRREPEFRGPPYHNYKPPRFQQMGVLTGQGGEILPLYGKASSSYRDRYNYYTATPGQQIYPLPISMGDRDCTEDIGCNELYGKEKVTVTGMTGEFDVNSYRTKTFN